jgi:hypothetical protein
MGYAKPLLELEVVGYQPIKSLLRGMYHKSTDENASTCVYVIQAWVAALPPPLRDLDRYMGRHETFSDAAPS